MIKAIFFDYDGVLVDSFPSVHDVYVTICRELGKSCPTNLHDFRKVYGDSSRDLMKNLGFSDVEVARANELYKEEILRKTPPLFEGIPAVLRELRNKFPLVLISSSPREDALKKLEIYDVRALFDIIFASEKSGSMRKPAAIKEALNKLGCTPQEVVLIGDRTIDYLEGIESGLPQKNILIVEYGWGYDSTRVPRQNVLVNNPADILHAIKKIESFP